MKHLSLFAMFTLIVPLTGCGDSGQPRGLVTGKVLVADKSPLTGGSIRFELASDSKIFGSGQIHADGSYECADAPVGECRVVVNNTYLQVGGATPGKLPGGGTMPGMGAPGKGGGMPGMAGSSAPGSGKAPSDAAKKMGGPPKGSDMPAEMNDGAGSVGTKYVKIDAKYASATDSPLKFTVVKGKNAHDFEVK